MKGKKFEDNPKSIKYYVKRYIFQNKENLVGKKVVDCHAGNGVTTILLQEVGARPIPYDLFPEYFELRGCEMYKGQYHG